MEDPIDNRIDNLNKPANYEFSLGNKIDTEKNFNPQSDLISNIDNSKDFSIHPNKSLISKYYYNETQENNQKENQINHVNTSKQINFIFYFYK
jgi:hypothetical protein